MEQENNSKTKEFEIDFSYLAEDKKDKEWFISETLDAFPERIKSIFTKEGVTKKIEESQSNNVRQMLRGNHSHASGNIRAKYYNYFSFDDKNHYIFNALKERLKLKWSKDYPLLLSNNEEERIKGIHDYFLKKDMNDEDQLKYFLRILRISSSEEVFRKLKEELKEEKKEKKEAEKKDYEITAKKKSESKKSNKKKQIEETVSPAENQKTEEKTTSAKEAKTDAKEQKKEEAPKEENTKTSKVENTDDVDAIRYDAFDIADALEKEDFIGTINSYSLMPSRQRNSWMCGIYPHQNMLADCGYSDLDGFYSGINMRFPVSFYTELDQTVLDQLNLPQHFDLIGENEQRNLLYDALQNTQIIFTFTNNSTKNEVKVKADILKIVPSSPDNDFDDAVMVPIISNLSFREFEKRMKNDGVIDLKNYCAGAVLHSVIRYIIIEKKIIRVAFTPAADNDPYLWTYKKGIYKVISSDYRKLEENSDYIFDNGNGSEDTFSCIFISKSLLDQLYNMEEEMTEKKVARETSSIQSSILPKEEKKVPLPPVQPQVISCEDENKLIDTVYHKTIENHLYYDKKDIINFHIALKSSQLVILAGESGTGKTRLPLIYADALNLAEGKNNLLFVPVSPAFTEPGDVLGYCKPYSDSGNKFNGEYVESSTGLVSFLKKASENRSSLSMVIFDEMNLSQIEYWFSPFISIMERKPGNRRLSLYSPSFSCSNGDKYPPEIEIGDNVMFIGTINLDETTRDISDRLLDRSIVIHLKKNSFADFYNNAPKQNEIKPVEKINVTANTFNKNFRRNKEDVIHSFTKEEIAFLDILNNYITAKNHQKGISYRALKIMANYINNAAPLEQSISRREAFDMILNQSVLTKINGADSSLNELLDEEGILAILNQHPEISDFTHCKEVLERKKQELSIYGITR